MFHFFRVRCLLLGAGILALGVRTSLSQIVMANQVVVPCAGVSGSDASAKIQCAINALPEAGGVVDARALPDPDGSGSTNIDPGTKPVSLLLGPFNYFFHRITLRGGMEIRGLGSPGGKPGMPGSGSTITSTNTTGELFSLAPYNQHAATNVLLRGFGIFGPGNTTGCTNQAPSAKTDAFLLDANLGHDSELWYSRFEDLFICGFSGNGIYFKGNAGKGGTHQYNTFTNIIVGRAANGDSALRIEGSAYQLQFINSVFDSNCFNTCIDNSENPNIFIGALSHGPASSYPYFIKFDGMTSQGTKTLVQIDGASNISFVHPHHEQACGAYLVTYGANGVPVQTDNLIIKEASFNGNVGIGTAKTLPGGNCGGPGSGFVLKSTTSNLRGVVLNDSVYLARDQGPAPDNWIKTVQGAEIVSENNEINVVGTWNQAAQSGVMKTEGMTRVIAAAGVIDTGHLHHVVLSGTKIIHAFNSSLTPGETITFSVNSSPGASFAPGNNLSLGGHPAIFLNAGDSVTFIRNDALPESWQILAMAIGPDGGMSKAKRFPQPLRGTCPTGASPGDACTSNDLLWTTPFADNDYTVNCTLTTATGQPHLVKYSKLERGTGITLTIATDMAVAANAGADCTAQHD